MLCAFLLPVPTSVQLLCLRRSKAAIFPLLCRSAPTTLRAACRSPSPPLHELAHAINATATFLNFSVASSTYNAARRHLSPPPPFLHGM